MKEPELRAAYEDLLKRHVAALRRLAWSYVREGGEDLFQEIAMGYGRRCHDFAATAMFDAAD